VETSLGDGELTWLDAPPGVLSFRRSTAAGDDQVTCVVNLSSEYVTLPPHREILVSSGPVDVTGLPPDTTVWLRSA
jgi:alpha-glucosidase